MWSYISIHTTRAGSCGRTSRSTPPGQGCVVVHLDPHYQGRVVWSYISIHTTRAGLCGRTSRSTLPGQGCVVVHLDPHYQGRVVWSYISIHTTRAGLCGNILCVTAIGSLLPSKVHQLNYVICIRASFTKVGGGYNRSFLTGGYSSVFFIGGLQ